MKKAIWLLLLVACMGILLSGHADKVNPFVGRWEGKNELGLPQAIIFNDDKTCRGVLSAGFAQLLVEGTYKYDSSSAVLHFKDISIDMGALGTYTNDGSAASNEVFSEMLNDKNELDLIAAYGSDKALLVNEKVLRIGKITFKKNADYVVQNIIKDNKLSGYWEPDIDAYLDYAQNLMALFGTSDVSIDDVFDIPQNDMPSIFFDAHGSAFVFRKGSYNKASYTQSGEDITLRYDNRALHCTLSKSILTIYANEGIGLHFIKTHAEKPDLSHKKLVGYWEKRARDGVHTGYYITSDGGINEILFSENDAVLQDKRLGDIQLCGSIIAIASDESKGYTIDLTTKTVKTKTEKELKKLLKAFESIDKMPDRCDEALMGVWQQKDSGNIAAIFPNGEGNINDSDARVKTKDGEIWFYSTMDKKERWYLKGKYKNGLMLLPGYGGSGQVVYNHVNVSELLNYTTDERGQITITGLKKPISILEIPESINGISVTKIAKEAFRGYNADKLKVVIMPDSIQMIGHSAFYKCTNLITVYLPHANYELGNYVFEGCTALTNVYNLSGAANIGSGCFAGCPNIQQ